MRLFSNSNGVQVLYAPIFDGRLLLGMSLFSKKYSISIKMFSSHTRENSQTQHEQEACRKGHWMGVVVKANVGSTDIVLILSLEIIMIALHGRELCAFKVWKLVISVDFHLISTQELTWVNGQFMYLLTEIVRVR